MVWGEGSDMTRLGSEMLNQTPVNGGEERGERESRS